MKKILLTLLLFFSSIISFGYCGYLGTPDYTYSQIPSQDFGGLTNQAYGDDSFLCIETCSLQGSVGGINFMDNRRKPIFYLVNLNFDSTQSCINSSVSNICFYVESTVLGFYYSVNNGNQYINMYQYVIGGGGGFNNCVGAVCEINFYDTYNQSTSQYTYNIVDGGYQSINVSYNSRYDGFQTINGDFAISPLQNTLECPARLNYCQDDLTTMSGNWNSCKTAYNTLSGNYNSCLSDLSNCQNSNNCSSLESAYSGCLSDLTTLSGNYNSCLGELNTCMNGNIGTGNIQRSALFINNIQHLGKPIINIEIPDEISWDYVSTGDNFELTVEGYNVDSDYIEGIINKQNYIPTTEDLSNVFSNLGLFGSLLVVCLFVILVFYMIKKIFS